ncbi:MAG: hypothetical protein M1490_05815 [Candidatus Bathyarchaeota archaeon]|nr:hypothetical protein [Candidatus Bathyarchaeota archaeon]
MNMQVEYKFKCPWCGEDFENANELNKHAKEHYAKCVI